MAEPSREAYDIASLALDDEYMTAHKLALQIDAFAAARVAEAIILPPLDDEWDYKGDDPVWKVIFRWIKVSVPAASQAMRSDGRTHRLHRAVTEMIAEARAQERERHAPFIEALRKIAVLDKHSGSSLRARAASEIARRALAEPEEKP